MWDNHPLSFKASHPHFCICVSWYLHNNTECTQNIASKESCSFPSACHLEIILFSSVPESFPAPLAVFQLTQFLSSFATRPLPLPLPLPFSLACEGSLSHSKTSEYCPPGCSFSFYPSIGQRQWCSEGLERVCHCVVPLSPTYAKYTPRPACCWVPDTKHPQQKRCSIRLKEHLVWAASFYAWVPGSQSCPVPITLTPLPHYLPQFCWEWAIDTKSLKFLTLLLN